MRGCDSWKARRHSVTRWSLASICGEPGSPTAATGESIGGASSIRGGGGARWCDETERSGGAEEGGVQQRQPGRSEGVAPLATRTGGATRGGAACSERRGAPHVLAADDA